MPFVAILRHGAFTRCSLFPLWQTLRHGAFLNQCIIILEISKEKVGLDEGRVGMKKGWKKERF